MANSFARALRHNLTEEQRILWSELRKRQLMGLRFRRQVPIGNYFVDFVRFERKHIVEVDGLRHGEPDNLERDEQRTRWLEAHGCRVFRAWNGEIRDDLNGVLESMLGEMGLLNPRTRLPTRVVERNKTKALPALADGGDDGEP